VPPGSFLSAFHDAAGARDEISCRHGHKRTGGVRRNAYDKYDFSPPF
jgi:hypothetical protein